MNVQTDTTPPASVTLFGTCLVDQFAPNVGEAVVSVLESFGIRVDYLADQTCCGQPAFNSGFRSEARAVATRFVELFESTDGDIVCPSGSCAAMVRNYYPVLFSEDSEMRARAEGVARRVYEFTEYLVDVLEVDGTTAGIEMRATYHECCHMLRELHIDAQPKRLLSKVPGLDLIDLNRSDVCCGFGGAFSVKMSDISTAMLEEKLANIELTGAKTVIASDTGCVMHMQGGLRRKGSDVQVVHIAEVLAGRIAE